MKPFRLRIRSSESSGGFSLVEATLSIGLMSFGFLCLAPLLALGLKTAHVAHDNRTTAQIAQTLIEEAKQGALASGILYLDLQGNPTTSAQAVYMARTTSQALPGIAALTRLTLQLTPVGAPDRVQTYAVVLPAP